MERPTYMRRLAVAALTLTMLLALAPATPARAERRSKVPSSVCDIDWRQGKHHVKELIRCAARRWHVPGGPDKAISVARCESGFDPKAKGGSNAGVFQQRLVYWPKRAKVYGFPDWSAYNGRANVIVSIRMAHRAGWGAWSCA